MVQVISEPQQSVLISRRMSCPPMVAEKLEFPISFKGLLSTLPFGREVITLKVCEPETVVKF